MTPTVYGPTRRRCQCSCGCKEGRLRDERSIKTKMCPDCRNRRKPHMNARGARIALEDANLSSVGRMP